jgi:hypothetical protein
VKNQRLPGSSSLNAAGLHHPFRRTPGGTKPTLFSVNLDPFQSFLTVTGYEVTDGDV